MDELTPVESVVARLARVSVLVHESSTVLAIEDAKRRAANGVDNRLGVSVRALDTIEHAVTVLAASLAQLTTNNKPVVVGTSKVVELSPAAKDAQSVLENFGMATEAARAHVLAGIAKVGDQDFDRLVSEVLKMVGQTKMGSQNGRNH